VQSRCCRSSVVHLAKQLCLQNVFPFLVLLSRLKCFVVLPAHRLVAFLALNVSYNVSASGHVAFSWFAFFNVDDIVKKVGFAVLPSEVSADNVVMIRQVSLAVGAAIDLARVEVDVICEAHGEGTDYL